MMPNWRTDWKNVTIGFLLVLLVVVAGGYPAYYFLRSSGRALAPKTPSPPSSVEKSRENNNSPGQNSIKDSSQANAEEEELIENGALFIQTLDLINKYYYKDVNLDELVYPAIGEMVKNLGPYSQFVSIKDGGKAADEKPPGNRIIQTNWGQIGYLKLASFGMLNHGALDGAMDEFKNKKISGLIIDLRGNEGGLIPFGMIALSYFLPPKTLVMTVKFRNFTEEKFFTAEYYDYYFNLPTVVFADKMSASVSEIFVGALRDHKKAIILGEKTFGKGLTQGVFELRDGSLLIFPTAEYFLPLGESIHQKGIRPHIQIDPADDEAMMEKAEEVLSHWKYYKKTYLE